MALTRRPVRTLVSALVAASLAACSVNLDTRSALSVQGAGSELSVFVLFVDGLSAAAFHRLLAAGALPNVASAIVARGLSYDTAVSCVPSETYPNVGALLTGLLPGHHGIPANIWLDRRLSIREAHTNIFRTYSASDFLTPQAKTLYERLPPGSVAITAPLARGATIQKRNVVSVVASYVRNDWPFLDRKTIDDVGDAYAGAARTGRLPPIVWSHLLGPDEIAHFDGPESAEYTKTLASIDRAFGRLVRRLKRLGVYDRILFVLLGDHGNASYSTFVNAEELVYRALFEHPAEVDCGRGGCAMVKKPGARSAAFDVREAKVAVGAYHGAMIWLPALRPPEELPRVFRTKKVRKREEKVAARRRVPLDAPPPPPSAFAAALARFPEIALVAARGSTPDEVELYGPAGRAVILREQPPDEPALFSYRVVEGTDPLGYAADPAIASRFGAFLPPGDWLTLTARTEYPDLVYQLSEFFDGTRSPDVFISPAPGIGFREGRAAGHGGFSRLETVVPLVFAGPGVAPGERPVARLVDLAPTLLSWLGVPFDADEMDGDDLVIRSAPAAPLPPLAPPPDDGND